MEKINKILKPQYKNIRIKLDDSIGYYLGYQMYFCLKEITKEEYKLNKLPILKEEIYK